MSVAVSVRGIASILSVLQIRQVALKEAKITFCIWAAQQWNLGQRPVPGQPSISVAILVLLIFLPSTFCDTGSVYNSSYETVIPKRLPGKGAEDPEEKVSYMLLMQGQEQLLHLKVKGHYSMKNFPVYSYHSGILGQEMPLVSQDCHYEGYMEGVPGSFVSVNICSGLRGVLIKEETSYVIEPMLSSKKYEHILYAVAHQPQAALMAHELGHNLGIQHDHPACTCDPKHFCLMHEKISKDSGFSNCSSDHFYRFLHDHRGSCLLDEPWRQSRKRRDASCGDGVVEEPEECDCGPNCEHHPCCESTCTLREGAECSEGLCCYKCTFRKKGTLCRPVEDVCDLPEYCNGKSQHCPANSYQQDGTRCDRIYFCSGGWCRNPDKQCTRIYGYPARSAPEDCYIAMNTKGNRFGNCGHPPSPNLGYETCTDEDVFCGKLVCTDVRYLPLVKPQHTLLQVPYGDDWCWSMDAYDMTDIPDYGDVQTGTFCAPNKVCVEYICTDHVVFQYDCKPQEMCHGHGVCNNFKHCHCDAGFAPPDCSSPGNGGSVDSGPVGKPAERNLSLFPVVDRRIEDEDVNLKVVVLVVPIFLVLLLCCLMLIAYLWSEVQFSEESSSDEDTEEEIKR
nr:disintegrin and metalloproteinase domain-containing protein 1a-like [Meriones unguiculatus]